MNINHNANRSVLEVWIKLSLELNLFLVGGHFHFVERICDICEFSVFVLRPDIALVFNSQGFTSKMGAKLFIAHYFPFIIWNEIMPCDDNSSPPHWILSRGVAFHSQSITGTHNGFNNRGQMDCLSWFESSIQQYQRLSLWLMDSEKSSHRELLRS